MNTSTAPQKPKRPRRWLKRLAWSFAWLVTLFALATVIENWLGARAWKELVKEMEAKGESLDIASVIPPLVPDEDNLASAPIFARLFDSTSADGKPDAEGTPLEDISMEPFMAKRQMHFHHHLWREGKFTDLSSIQEQYWERARTFKPAPEKVMGLAAVWWIHFKKDYWNGEKQSPAEDVLFALSAFAEELEQVEEACERPSARFPIPYESGFQGSRAPYLNVIKNFSELFSLKASAELALKHSEVALKDIQTALKLLDSLRTEPNLRSYFCRTQFIQAPFQPIWEGIVKHRWNDEQLARLEKDIAPINFIREVLNGIRGDRTLGLHYGSSHVLRTASIYGWGYAVLLKIIPEGFFDFNKVNVARTWQKYVECADANSMRIFPERIAALDAERKQTAKISFEPHTVPHTIFARGIYHVMDPVQIFFGLGLNQNHIGLVRIAIALERHYLKHGSYPESLVALDESFSLKGGIPHDFATGNPPHYSRTSSDRFVLFYKNEGINPAYEDDLVWHMPAE